jgi:hypothetical protein
MWTKLGKTAGTAGWFRPWPPCGSTFSDILRIFEPAFEDGSNQQRYDPAVTAGSPLGGRFSRAVHLLYS